VPGYYTDAGADLHSGEEVGLTVPIFGGDGWESEKLTEIGKEAVEGTYFSTHYSPDAGGPKGEPSLMPTRSVTMGSSPTPWPRSVRQCDDPRRRNQACEQH
jgi:branched-chain amino acid transport system substrate-binding protein